MKKTLLSILLMLCASTVCFGFDWKPQTNEELRTDMLTFCQQFARDAKGTRTGRMVKRFMRQQQKQAEQAPYQWICDTYTLVDRLKAMNGPMVDDGSRKALIRRDILRLLDYPLHVVEYASDAPAESVANFRQVTSAWRGDARSKALDFVSRPAPEPGVLEVLKVYNMGFILRTSERCFVVDLRWDGTADEAAAIAAKADAFFLTHPHGDHFNPLMVDAMTQAGKAVVLPCSTLRGCTFGDNLIALEEDVTEPVDVCGISVSTLFGNQGKDVPCNVYILEFDGWRIIDTGDNAVKEKYAALAHYRAADLLLVPSWNSIKSVFTPCMQAPGATACPPLYIPCHENELGHTVDHRESFKEFFKREDRYGDATYAYPPFMIMDIGEQYTFRHPTK